MPLVIPNTTTQDDYTVGTSFAGTDVFSSGYFTIANNSAAVELSAGIFGQSSPIATLFLPPGTYPIRGGSKEPISGLRFKSFVAGEAAQIFGVLFYPGEPTIEAASPFDATVSASGSVTPAGVGMQLIERQVLAVDSSIVTFSAIPNSFKHLKIFWIGATSAAVEKDLALRFNGDTANNYSMDYLQTLDGVVSPGSDIGIGYLRVGVITRSVAGNSAGEINILAYSSTLGKNAYGTETQVGSTRRVGIYGGRWFAAAVISQVSIAPGFDGSNIVSGSIFDLFGIA